MDSVALAFSKELTVFFFRFSGENKIYFNKSQKNLKSSRLCLICNRFVTLKGKIMSGGGGGG